jgi:arylsulfatase A-like enzyme
LVKFLETNININIINFTSMKLIKIFIIIFFLTNCGSKEDKTDKRPNIVFLIADDAGYGDFGCYGQEVFTTPNIDRMAAEGMLFTQHYSGSTVCAPSRSSLMTGQHTGHTFIRGNKWMKPEGQYPLPDTINILPELLKRAGYITGGFGKWGLGGPGSEGDPVNQGFDTWFGYNCQRLAHNYYPEYLWGNRDTVFLHGNDNGGVTQFSYDLIHQEALKFIENNKENPFFLFLPYTIPHAEIIVPDDSLLHKYLGEFEEVPYKGVDEGPQYRKGPYGSQETPRAVFAAMMERLDLSVGDIIRKLDDLDIGNNTIFILTSDNGPHLEGGADPDFFNSNGIYRGYKRDLYEGGIRVPFIVRWPDMVQGSIKTGHVSAFWDILPTLCEIAGIAPPQNIDGISFLPTLKQEGRQIKHHYLYWEFYEQGGKQAVRLDYWKGIRLNLKDNPDGPIELYNLAEDPEEKTEISEKHPEVVREIEKLMLEAHSPSGIFTYK